MYSRNYSLCRFRKASRRGFGQGRSDHSLVGYKIVVNVTHRMTINVHYIGDLSCFEIINLDKITSVITTST